MREGRGNSVNTATSQDGREELADQSAQSDTVSIPIESGSLFENREVGFRRRGGGRWARFVDADRCELSL